MRIPVRIAEVKALSSCIISAFPTGSRVINPGQSPLGVTDYDWLILAKEGFQDDPFFEREVDLASGKVYEMSDVVVYYAMNGMGSKVDFIVTHNPETFRKWADATVLANRMKLDIKAQRIILFEYMMSGNVIDQQVDEKANYHWNPRVDDDETVQEFDLGTPRQPVALNPAGVHTHTLPLNREDGTPHQLSVSMNAQGHRVVHLNDYEGTTVILP